ncbi:hypothetical protein BB561_000403 [Smittium simulii]|uniref:Intimal thickness related receptor IRP domain-containing protein n=1 Tax=Smittium simulii TaxID=133385 RepID=A0A2T9YZG3_9FUNG|nr:hypothetical protein BB561_000403 [Smittium simulii]
MKARNTVFFFLFLLSLATAEYIFLNKKDQSSLKCAGIIKGDSVKPSNISITFTPTNDQNITVLLFNWDDIDKIGVWFKEKKPPNRNKIAVICNQESLEEGLCSEADLGRAIISKKNSRDEDNIFYAPIYNDQVSLAKLGMGYTSLERIQYFQSKKGVNSWKKYIKNPRNSNILLLDGLNQDQAAHANIDWNEFGAVNIVYTVNTTGYYCIDVASDVDYFGKAVWTNGYGFISASEYIKLPFYKIMTLVYTVYCIAWIYISIRVWRDVLPLQHYIWVLIAIMVTNMGLSSMYWEHYNKTGVVDLPLTIVMVFFYAARNSLSFFLLLVVSLGWGIVRPSLGSTMKRCVILLIVHFISGCVYGTSGALRDASEMNNESLLVVLPVSICMTIYYIWIMKAVIATTRILEQRGQTYKLQLFHKMWYLLLLNIIAFIFFIVVSFITIFMMINKNSISKLWKYQWLIFDGWLNVQFFISFSFILWWWRPTSNNNRYGLEQLAGDESGVWERGPNHDGHVMMLADERDFQLALEEADQVADSFVLHNKITANSSEDNDNRSSFSSFDREVFVLDDDEYDDDNQYDNDEPSRLNTRKTNASGEHDNYKLRQSKDH